MTVHDTKTQGTETQDASFPVDFVYTWVDGARNAEERARYLPQAGDTTVDANTSNRFRDNDELLHSIQSVRAFAPWVRRIVVVTSGGQRPDWHRPGRDTDVEIVDDAALYGDDLGRLLPVFNSHSIEALLHRIPGLAEHFVYFNDDMFIGRPVSKLDFFTADGRARIRTTERIRPSWETHCKSWRVYRGNARRLLETACGCQAAYCTTHQARALRRSACEQCWEHPGVREALRATAASRFRSRADVSPIEVFSNMMLHQGDGVRERYVGLVICAHDHSLLGPEFAALRLRRPMLYCINDDMHDPGEEQLARLRHALSTGLPHQRSGAPAWRPVGAVLPPLTRLLSAAWRLMSGPLHSAAP